MTVVVDKKIKKKDFQKILALAARSVHEKPWLHFEHLPTSMLNIFS